MLTVAMEVVGRTTHRLEHLVENDKRHLEAPIAQAERHDILDILRGFALFGVLLANMVLTTQFLALTQQQRAARPTPDLDKVGEFFTGTLVDGKFFTLFSILFGLGFAVQLARASDRGVSVLPTYSRRLSILFVIGALHGMLLWFGDVLHIYALLGFVLILFRNRSERTVLVWAIGIGCFVVVRPILDCYATSQGWEHFMAFGRGVPSSELYERLMQGTYADLIALNWDVHLQDYGEIGFGGNIVWWHLDILSKLLFGFYLGRRMVLQRATAYRELFQRALPWLLPIGLIGSAYMQMAWVYDIGLPEDAMWRAVLDGLHQLFVVVLALAYVCVITLLHQHPRWAARMHVLAPMGRMALTNYLTHSVCFLLIFYGLGLGLLGKAGTAACIALSFAIFALQVALSRWWLKRYRFGPVEWLWRCLTYGKRQPLRQVR